MIQRIQSVWLFLAAIFSALLFLGYTGVVYKADIPQGFGSVVRELTVSGHFPSLIVAVLMTLIPLVALFMFKNRKQQKTITLIGLLVSLMFTVLNLMRISGFEKNTSPQPVNGSYQIGSVIPILVIIFLILAIRGIRKDEKLIRSMDRLR